MKYLGLWFMYLYIRINFATLTQIVFFFGQLAVTLVTSTCFNSKLVLLKNIFLSWTLCKIYRILNSINNNPIYYHNMMIFKRGFSQCDLCVLIYNNCMYLICFLNNSISLLIFEAEFIFYLNGFLNFIYELRTTYLDRVRVCLLCVSSILLNGTVFPIPVKYFTHQCKILTLLNTYL